jgi:hypothetical protein
MTGIAYATATVLAAVSLSWLPASAAGHRVKAWHAERVDRDCTPINGRFGYYGNPWCDTGSYRLEDIEFRERQAHLRRWKTER